MTSVPEQIRELWEREITIEPAPGAATAKQVEELKGPLDDLRGGSGPYRRQGTSVLDGIPAEDRAEMQTMIARVLARGATIAYAAGERETGYEWLSAAADLAHEAELKEQLEAAKREPERYRMLVHGRYLFAHDREGAARKAWKKVARAGKDALGTAAREELAAPRPIRSVPSLYRMNGIGTGFYGGRDHYQDGSYVTTHCFSVLWVPIIPLRAFRVRRSGGGYSILAREQLSVFAKVARLAVLASVVLAITGTAVSSYLHDPDRLARNRFADAIDGAAGAKGAAREAALRRLDAELTGVDVDRVAPATAQRAGAAVITLTAGYVPEPFKADDVDQAGRVVSRYQQLPPEAKGGAALDALLAAMDRWSDAVAKDPQAQLALLRREVEVADPAHAAKIAERVSAARLAVARVQEKDDPLAALAVLTEDSKDSQALAEATAVIKTLADKPSLLDDAGAEIEAWTASGSADPELAKQVVAQRAAAQAAREEVEADGVTRAQLEKMLKQRPWDQRAALALARLDTDAGKLEAADARLRAFGPPGLLVRDARLELAQIALAQGKLDEADALVSPILAARLPSFTAASAALDTAIKHVQDRIKQELDAGAIPNDLQLKLEGASDDDQRSLIQDWVAEQVKSDANVATARERYAAYEDVVPTAIFAGTVELRRAQPMSGAARDAMLDRAEKAFLAVRTEAEGQPEFNIGLGEIYARLGKDKESEAELKGVLDKNDPELSLRVAQVYRGLGRIERAKEVAKHVYETSTSPIKEVTANLLGVFYQDDIDESEKWFLKADQKDPSVKISLLEIRGRRELRDGKRAECAATFAEIARRYLAIASAANLTAYNNASVADGNRFDCSGDPAALRDAEDALDKAYRASSEEPIVVGNLATMLESNTMVRAIAKRVDLRALHAGGGDAETLATALLDSPERDALLADLASDPAWRRSADLASHFEVLAPSNAFPYQLELARAYRLRDEAAASVVLDRLRHAKTLDTSLADDEQKKWQSGADDDKRKGDAEQAIALYDGVLKAGGIAPHTRAAALYLEAHDLHDLGTYWNQPEMIERAISAREEAAKLWPALTDESDLAAYTLDEAGVTADAARWGKLRRGHSAAAVLDKLVADNDPLAAKIRGSAQWAQVAAHMRASNERPSVDDLRLARLLGDAQVESHARAVLDDKLGHMMLEAAAIANPASISTREDLDYLAKH